MGAGLPFPDILRSAISCVERSAKTWESTRRRNVNGAQVVADSYATAEINVIEPRCIDRSALPPNKGMEPTVKSVTPLAKRGARVAPLFPAAHPRR